MVRLRASWPFSLSSAPTVGNPCRPLQPESVLPERNRRWPWCTDQGCGRNDPYPVLGSCDAGGLRASQLQHAVQDLDRYVHLSRPTLIRTRAQPVPDHTLEPADGGLGPGTLIIP